VTVDGVRVPRHEPGPPETLTDTDYANLLRVPDRRTLAGKRDYALRGAANLVLARRRSASGGVVSCPEGANHGSCSACQRALLP